jgi:hypothetical protein
MKRVVPTTFAIVFASIPAVCYFIVAVLKKKLPFPQEPVLGLAEIAGWLYHGDDGHLHLLYATGLPVAIVVYGAIGWGIGCIALWAFRIVKPVPDPGREAGG